MSDSRKTPKRVNCLLTDSPKCWWWNSMHGQNLSDLCVNYIHSTPTLSAKALNLWPGLVHWQAKDTDFTNLHPGELQLSLECCVDTAVNLFFHILFIADFHGISRKHPRWHRLLQDMFELSRAQLWIRPGITLTGWPLFIYTPASTRDLSLNKYSY